MAVIDERLIELIRRTHEDAPYPVLCLLQDCTIAYFNPAARDIVREHSGSIKCVECPDDPAENGPSCRNCLLKPVLHDGAPRSRVLRVMTPGGEARWTGQQWHAVRDYNGTIACVIRESLNLISDVQTQDGTSSSDGPPLSGSESGIMRRLLDVAAAAVLVLDFSGRVTLANRKALELLGLREEEVLGRSWIQDFVPEDYREECRSRFEHVLGQGSPAFPPCEHPVLRPDGTTRVIEWHNTVFTDENGNTTGVFASGIDVTRRRDAETELRFRSTVLDKANDAVVVHEIDGAPVYANERVCAMCGFTREEFLDMPPFGWLDPEHREIHQPVREALSHTGAAIFETLFLASDGTRLPVEVHAKVTTVDERELVVAAARDVTERKLAGQTMTRLAFYDPLTGLANRALFLDRLRHTASASRRSGERIAVAFVDLDHFKSVNDSLGHSAGDAVLIELAGRIKARMREADTVARLGGDEFTVLMSGIRSSEDAERVARKLLECFRDPVIASGQEVYVTASIGIAIGSAGEIEDVGTLLSRADTAMYRAKHGGRDTYCLHESHLEDDSRELFALKNDLHGALDRGEIELAFQPIVRVDDGLLTAVETFVRWNHPVAGYVPPSTFIPLAEESGLIVTIGGWVIHRACEQFGEWQRSGLATDARLTVNLSARQFSEPNLAHKIGTLIYENGLLPTALELEITEGTFRHGEGLHTTWNDLRDLGVRIAIDDFGSGYSSLEQLLRFEVDALKIDQAFVKGLGRSPRSTAVCRAVISIGRQLGLTVTAEGVETRMQHACLRAEKCEEMQGHLVSKAVSAESLAPLLTRDHLIHWRDQPQEHESLL